jgi:transposase
MYPKKDLLLAKKAFEIAQSTKDVIVFKKCAAIYFFDLFNVPIKDIAILLDRTVRTISCYRKEFKEGGALSIKTKRSRAYASIEQEKEFISYFIKKAQRGDVINLKQIHQSYNEDFNVEANESTVYRMMIRNHWRKIVPRPSNPKKDKKAEEDFKNSILKKRIRQNSQKDQ